MNRGTVFTKNKDIVKAKGFIPYWRIAEKLGVHENTLRNWMRKEMDQDKKNKVLKAIEEVKKDALQVS